MRRQLITTTLAGIVFLANMGLALAAFNPPPIPPKGTEGPDIRAKVPPKSTEGPDIRHSLLVRATEGLMAR